jgi:phosphonate transport system ATP-binding protein
MIELHGLSKIYCNGLQALAPTDLTFNAKEFCVLLGSSGAGKSTLLRSLNLLNTSSHGYIKVSGLGILDNKSKLSAHRRRTGFIFQQHQLIEHRTALQNVLLGRLCHHSFWRGLYPLPKRDLHIALSCLERVGILDKALSKVSQLSGGQQQRVGIARALAQEPAILLADEPVASLDPASSHSVLSLLHDICREKNLCLVVSLHQMELAVTFADRIIGLAAGQVVFDGSPQQLNASQVQTIYGNTTGRLIEQTTQAPTHMAA